MLVTLLWNTKAVCIPQIKCCAWGVGTEVGTWVLRGGDKPLTMLSRLWPCSLPFLRRWLDSSSWLNLKMKSSSRRSSHQVWWLDFILLILSLSKVEGLKMESFLSYPCLVSLLCQHVNMTSCKASVLWQEAVNKPGLQGSLPLSGDHSFHLQHHQLGRSKSQSGSFFQTSLPVCGGKEVSAPMKKVSLVRAGIEI